MFPLLNLPWVPIEQILKRMDYSELFIFSILSKRCTTIAERFKCKVEEIKWVLQFGKMEIKMGTRYFYETLIGFDADPSNARITGFSVKNEREAYSDIWIGSKEVTMLNTLEKISEHILKIFKVKILRFFYVEPSLVMSYNFWRTLNLSLETFNYYSPNYCIDSNSMTFLLDNIKTDCLELDLQVGPGFQYSKPLKFNGLYISKADWFTLENLLNMECEKLVLARTCISSSDLNAFFEKWKQGLFPKLNELRLSTPMRRTWDLRINDTDRYGRPLMTDIYGNRGIFERNSYDFIWFLVSFQT